MSELTEVLESAIGEAESGRAAALCCIVATRGSTPQCPGAMMLVRADGKTAGTLGGGCVEAEVRRRSLEMLGARRSGLLDFLLDHDFGWDDGLICGGRMIVGVVPLDSPQAARPFRDALGLARQRKAASFPITIEHEGRPQSYRVRLEVPPTLLIAGAGHVGQAVARLAVDLDFHVIVVDDRADMASRGRFDPRVELVVRDIPAALRAYPLDEGCFVVIVTRGHQHDEQALEAVVRRRTGYIGLIGSRRKSRLIMDDLRAAGVTDEMLARVHTPIGLPISAVTVPEIAVSIAAELVQTRRKIAPVLVEGPFPPP